MPRYDALVTVKVTREYVIRLEVTAENISDADDKLRWEALGMTGKQIANLAHSTDSESSDEGEEREVTLVYGIEELPEDYNHPNDNDPQESDPR